MKYQFNTFPLFKRKLMKEILVNTIVRISMDLSLEKRSLFI